MEPYEISFSGETLPGCHPDAARSRLAQYFQLDPDSDLERFFSGEKVVLKRLLDRNTALSTYQDLRRLGIVVIIEKMDPDEAAEAQRKLDQQREAERQKEADRERQVTLQQQVQQRREQAEREAAKQRAQQARAARQTGEQKKAMRHAAAREEAAKEKAAQEKAAKEKAAREKAAQQKAAKDKAAKEKAANTKLAREKAAREKAAREKAAREKSATEKAARKHPAQQKADQQKLAKTRAAKQKTVQQQAASKTPRPAAKARVAAKKPTVTQPAARPAPKAPAPKTRASATGKRRKRQAGAPNLFDIRLSRGALKEAQKRDEHFSGAPMLGAAIMLVAFVLVGLRFWVESLDSPASGLGPVAVDSALRPAVVVNDQLLRHDRAGNPGELMDFAAIDLSPATPIAFLESGALLQQLPPSGQALPAWLRDLLDIDAEPGRLQLCTLRDTRCELLLQPLDEGAFTLNRDGGYLVVADVLSNRLMKYDTSGNALASRPIALSSPVHVAVHDGVLYLTQGNSDVVKALRTENVNFGEELGLYTLAVDGAQATGHIFPGALAWLGQHWWVVMQSRDSSTAGLYRFDTRWQAVDAVPLPDGAHPGQPVPWGEKLLVPDAGLDSVYRVAADNSVEAPFSAEPIASALLKRRSQLEQTGSLQAVVMLVLFFAATGLFVFGSVKSLQGKIYQAVNDTDEKAFDIESDSIQWLDPGRDARTLLRRGGFALAVLVFLMLAMAVILKPGLGITVAALVVLAGIGGYGYAVYQSWGCHLGRLGDQLVVVDHKSTYRVGHGPRIQYVHNYVMIDDVIVYLGNPLLPQFADKPLQQEFEPIVTRGIKVDRTTLRLKLINSRHPMLFGNAGLIFSLGVALIILLLA